ncbi:hypothetical protein VTO42DRAFT_7153 [Malbranchea cinnamomea]
MDLKTDVDRSENKGPPILAIMWVLTMFTALLVAVRLYIRVFMLRRFGLDDWLVLISIILGFIYVGVTTANVIGGYGKHAITLRDTEMEKAVLLNSISFIFGILSFSVPKMAVVALLNKILNPGKLHYWWLWFLVVFTAVSGGGCVLILFLMCSPPQALWKAIPGATCLDPWILIWYSTYVGALSAFVDLYLAIYPSTVLFKLHMSLRKKLALSAALGLGSIAATMAIVKVIQLKGLADKSDYTYSTAELVLWTNIEADVVLIASCIPTLQPLLEHINKSRFGSTGKKSKYSNNLGNNSSGYGPSDRSNASRLHGCHHRSKTKSDLTTTAGGSQESILRGYAHIRRTDDVVVEYELDDRSPDKDTTERNP